MMKVIKFRLCIIKSKCYTFCGKTRVMNYFIIYFINLIRNQLHSIALYNKVKGMEVGERGRKFDINVVRPGHAAGGCSDRITRCN